MSSKQGSPQPHGPSLSSSTLLGFWNNAILRLMQIFWPVSVLILISCGTSHPHRNPATGSPEPSRLPNTDVQSERLPSFLDGCPINPEICSLAARVEASLENGTTDFLVSLLSPRTYFCRSSYQVVDAPLPLCD